MLTSIIAMMALLVSGGYNHLAGDAAAVDITIIDDNPYKPEDPSTLTLALIGAGTLAVYLLSRRAMRTRDVSTSAQVAGPQQEPSLEAAALPSAHVEQTPSRGAA
jgi:hypothetical protein